MKITIGGITIEGTPKELAEYDRLVDIKAPDTRASRDDGKAPFMPNIYCSATCPSCLNG